MARPRKSSEPLPEWAARIAALRRAAGLSQAGLALEVGVSQQAVAEWEAGRNYPRAETLSRLAIALDVTPAEVAPAVTRLEEPQQGIETLAEVDTQFAAMLEAFLRQVDARIDPPLPMVIKVRLFRHLWRAAGGEETRAPEPERMREMLASAVETLAVTGGSGGARGSTRNSR